MKKLIISSLLALALIGSTVITKAANTNSTSFFNKNEFGLSLGTGYIVDRASAFKQDYLFNLVVGAHYFPSKYLGFQAAVPFYNTDGISFTEVQGGFVLRLPIGFVAPYTGVSAVYNWNSQDKFAYIAKGGIELRFNSKVGIFTEGQYRNNNFTWEKGSTSIVGGIKFNF